MGTKKESKTKKKDKSKQKKKKVVKRSTRPTSSSKSSKSSNKDSELYCVCRQSWDGNSLMVQCDQCQDWFHPKCVGVSTKEAKDNPFICPSCQDKPILKLPSYKMGSYTSKMQLSYFESVDPKRLYQLYSIPDIAKYSNSSTFNNRSNQSIIQQIIPSQQLQQVQQKLFQQLQSNPNDIHHQKIYQQFNNELIFIISQKRSKVLSMSHFNKIITFILALKFSYHNLINFDCWCCCYNIYCKETWQCLC